MAIFIGKLKTFHFQSLILFSLIAVLQAQDQPGFINIDCGLPNTTNNYTDTKTKLLYVSDSGFVDTGISKSISTEYTSYDISQQLQNVRSFPEGDRNCYEIKLAKGNEYLIRAMFMYGNYDAQNQAPAFDLHIGSKKWDTVKAVNATTIITKEIMHVTNSDYIDICLVNTKTGTPFISTLELRPVNKSSYQTDFGSLALFARLDIGASTNQFSRYVDDVLDRIWAPFRYFKWTDINTTETVDLVSQNIFRVPSAVMRTAGTATNPDEPMILSIDTEDTSLGFLVYMHFAEIVKPEANKSRVFNISYNGQPFYGPVKLDYLYTTTVYSTSLLTGGKYEFSMFKVENSTLPPLINGIEIFYVIDLSQTLSNQEDVDAIKNIKKSYGIKRNWQGDPCAPREFLWDGLNCSYNEIDEPRIISLNLSSIGLSGEIPPSISSLTSLQSLDLSNNNLTGSIPDFLSQLPSLKVLNLSENKLSGSVPEPLIEKSNKKTLELSIGGNPNLCASNSCKSTKKSKAVPIVGSVAGVIIFVAALVTVFYILKRRKQKGATLTFGAKEEGRSNSERKALEPKGRNFTYSELKSMTNNFQRVLGKGGFGTVYHGYLDDTQVAVKILSQSSAQGYKEFRSEVRLLLRVHHRNLTSLVGFCDEGTVMGLIYEYMANGDLEHLISGSNRKGFGWDRRLQVVVEAAQGLEYLHNGCKPPIVHRDIKPANILLNDKFHAKLADFGLSRSFPIEGGSHISTVIAGTPGYLDPEYSVTNWLTEKSDVYSFGIVLLKTITGRPVIAMENGRNTHICQWVKSLLENGDIKSIVDGSLGDDCDINSVWKAVEIAMACTSPTSDGRPTMHRVVTELNQCLAEEIARKKQGRETDSSGSMFEEITSFALMTETMPFAR